MTAATMHTRTIGSHRARAASQRREAKVEFRAATLTEIRRIDLTAAEIVLPAHVFMTHTQFRNAIAPFPFERPPFHGTPLRPPGSLIWAQRATPSGDVIVGGRDTNGLPSFPIPTPSGDIFFLSGVAASGRGAGTAPSSMDIPTILFERLTIEPDSCSPILAADDSIACAFPDCGDCLQVLTRNSWKTSIACACGH
jgi:hypothetical protein